MKKILGLAIAAFMVVGLVGGGTWAYFSDTETSTGNTLAAGTLDLTLDGGNSNVVLYNNVSNLYPGDTDNASTTLANAGNLAGELDISIAITNTESTGSTEYEADGDAGELGGYLLLAIFIDVNENGQYDAGTDIGLNSSESMYTSGALVWATADEYDGDAWDNVYSGTMANGVSDGFFVLYDLPTSVSDNDCQGDGVGMAITFTFQQPEADS